MLTLSLRTTLNAQTSPTAFDPLAHFSLPQFCRPSVRAAPREPARPQTCVFASTKLTCRTPPASQYLYSPVDELIPPEDVERHAAEARSRSAVRDVRLERFEKSPHVAHARTDPERYWRAIRRIWEESAEERRT